jgi:hypothetical protein
MLRLLLEDFRDLMRHGVQIAANRAMYHNRQDVTPRVIF